MSQTLKKRGKKAGSSSTSSTDVHPDPIVDTKKTTSFFTQKEPESAYWIALAAVTAVAAFVRFRLLGTPAKVVFDEVHFGKFASYYLERTYFFDLHPPFAKLLIAFAGWLVGYDGSFKFENIGDNYIENNVPYIAYRTLSAIQGTLIVPVMFMTMKTLGFTVAACVLSSSLVLFDNAQVIDSRLILLDATLILSVALTMFTYCKFSTYRRQPFSKWWWIWLLATGVSLSCVISTKYVGVFTYFTIGIAVIHELWILLDIKKGLSIEEFAQHFLARFFSLIVMPFVIYLFWFYLHFAILTKSGPGDAFMSSEFQETLEESPMAKYSKSVHYHDVLTIQHKETEAFLHSHDLVYPLRYENGRISSNLQQVTCVYDQEGQEIKDVNSQWEIVPTKEVGPNSKVYTNDVVRFRHIGTGGFLLTHDVASPLLSTNEEFVVVHGDVADTRYNETLFRLRFAEAGGKNKNKRVAIKTKATPMRVLHVDTVVAMWTHDDELLPDWALEHQEVSGNKKVQDGDNVWTFDSIVNMKREDPRNHYVPKEVKTLPFLKKWWELQGLMFLHNNKLSAEHPFASQPDAWPLALSGVSFWNDNDERKQIFFIGNVIGFWIEVGFLAVYVGFVLADLVTQRRAVEIITPQARSRLYNTLGFFFIGWAAHYFPFYLMGRQKFLHHYLPAHLIAALFTGAIVEFLCTNKTAKNMKGLAPAAIDKVRLISATVVVIASTAWFLWYMKAITYGNMALPAEEIKKRQWLDINLHYAK
ncbi:hypothetical protein RJF_1646 [Candidozyma auris]